MSSKEEPRESISAKISGPVSGQVAVGKDIRQSQTISAEQRQVTEEELASLQQMFVDLKAQVESEAPPEKREAALERIDELEEAINPEEPDLSTMEYVKGWFTRNIPTLAGAVISVVVHPIVGKVVAAAGDLAVEEFQRRFGHEEGNPAPQGE